MLYLVVDIETVANDRASEYVQKKTYEPDARLKDPDKIEASLLKKRQADMDKAGLYWWLGKVICISAQDFVGNKFSFSGANEIQVLTDFFDLLVDDYDSATLVGKSSQDFDFPFLVGRALAHDLGIPHHFRTDRLRDVDHIFSRSPRCSQVSTLSNYAWGLGIDGKLAHGSDVQDMYNIAITGDQKQWSVITDYCDQDVEITTEMLKRYLKRYESLKTKKEPVNMEGVF